MVTAAQKADEWSFGRLSDEELEAADWTPIPFTLYGYDRETKEEHSFEFHAKASAPFGATLDVTRLTDANGDIPGNIAIQYLYDCLEEKDKAQWDEVVKRGELAFDPDILAQMAQKFVDYYNGGDEAVRPPAPRSARRAGSRRGGGTSTVKHDGRASTSARSPSQKR